MYTYKYRYYVYIRDVNESINNNSIRFVLKL